MGKSLILAGILLILVGLAIQFSEKFKFLGKLPGDFSWNGKNFSFHFPMMTSLLVSLLLTLVLFLYRKWMD